MKLIKYITIIVLSFWFSSCNDFLETDSPSRLAMELKTEGDIFLAIKGVYTEMTDDNAYGLRFPFYYSVNTDIENAWTDASYSNTRYGLFDYTTSSDNTELANPWTKMYTCINLANACIWGVEQGGLLENFSPDKASNIGQLYGEAKALRAMFYFDLVKNWGDVPFKLTPTQFDDDFYLPRTNRDTILTYLINELTEIEPTMYYADQMSEGIERMNRGAVQGLIARLALWRAGYSLRPDMNNPSAKGEMRRPDNQEEVMTYYSIANTYSKMLMESGRHSLGTDFKQVFVNECQYITPKSGDVLYELAYQKGSRSDVGNYIGVRIETNPTNWGNSQGNVRPAYPYFFSFDDQDTRRDITCCLYRYVYNPVNQRLEQNMNASIEKLTIGKWNRLWMNSPMGLNSSKGTGINFPIIRFSDVLLMFAESENELNGPTASAKEALKEVRRRAFPENAWSSKVDAYVNGLGSSEDFFNAIVNERAWEFGGESIRKYDLVRWNLLSSKLLQTKNDIIRIAASAKTNTPIDDLCPTGTAGSAAKVYPNKIYYKVMDDGNMDIVGAYTRTAKPNGYGEFNWCISFTNSSNVPTALISNGYRDEILNNPPVVHILPIHNSIILESKGILKNYYGQ